jgi:signal transduction histidine kinase
MVARPQIRRVAAAALVAASLAGSVSAAAPNHPKRVLLVHYGDGSLPAFVEFEQSLVENLRSAAGPDLEFYREQLDTVRFPQYVERRIAEFRWRYAQRKMDVVIFFGEVPTSVLPGVPVVQVDNGVSTLALRNTYGSNWVHVTFNLDARKTIDAARRLQPKARKVLLISGTAADDYVYLEQFQKQLVGEDLDVESINNLSVPDLRALVSRLPRDVIVFPVAYLRDPKGKNHVMHDVMEQLGQASSAPVYGISDTFIGTGIVGGYVVNWTKLGELTADAALQIVHGKAPQDVVLKSPGADSYIFDWRQLKRWGFSESGLPPGSVVKYKVPTAWEQYRWRIVAIGVLLIAQFVLIVNLLIQRYQRRKAEKSLHDMTGRLLQSQDDERRRIARDLHDGTGQHLSGIALSVGQVLADFPCGYDRLRQLLQDSHVASRQALNEIRAVSYALHPPILDGLGLKPALQWYLDGLQKRTNFSINFEAPPDLASAAPDAERALFRIVQESIANVLRHSAGTAVKVKLSDGPKGITLEIEDNGHGMSSEEFERVEGAMSLGVGIAGMRERVRQLKGTFNISSSANGTRVLVVLPTHKKQYAAHSAG